MNFEISEKQPAPITLDRALPPTPADQPLGQHGMPDEATTPERRHGTLMDCLTDEGERQAEERFQMAIDADYNDHMHWREEDAAVLRERGQAPLVFNQGRQSIEWISGTEKRMRKDFKALPREPDDEAGAELKTTLLKYTDDANMTQWHRSAAFKEMCVSGLSWLEEGINSDPSQEIIYSGSESWRNVLRDSRGRDIMLRDWRYCFRRKRLDLDYATALLAGVAGDRIHVLRSAADSRTNDDEAIDSAWYLGERLTGATEGMNGMRKPTSFDERGAYMMNTGYYDTGRRMSVDIIEAWYRVPEMVKVFVGGMFDGQIFNEADQRMQWAVKRERANLRDAVKMRMRVMMCTENHYLWDGPSPYTHGQFLLVPLIAYRRSRDGMIYGVWRGMRDLSDDTNKRRAKALWALSSNRVITDEENVTEDQDLDMIRQEAARVDGVLVTRKAGTLSIVENKMDVQGNLQMAAENSSIMREMGGVTGENLGYNTNAQSGKAILAKQDQGSLTTSDLFDNYQLAIKLQGKLRLSHMEQFWTERKAIRIAGRGKPFEWVVLNEFDEETGEWKNDITQRQADFEVDTQDFRTSAAQAAMEQMFALLGQIATFAPEVVLSVLDLVVENADIKNKAEWITRIRKLNGQRDPTKAPTPEEMAADAVEQDKQKKADALVELMGEAELKLKQAMGKKTDAEATLKTVDAAMKRVQSMMSALEASIVVTNAPQVVPAADAITSAAGLDDMAAAPGSLPAPPTSAQPPIDATGAPMPDPMAAPPIASAGQPVPGAGAEGDPAMSLPQ